MSFFGTTEYLLEVSRGNIPGEKVFVIAGRKNSISSTVLDDLTQIPGTTVAPIPGGIQLAVASSSAADTSAGTGIQTIEVSYLDAAGAEQQEVVTMNGTTLVNFVATDVDNVQWMHAQTVGTGAVAAGNIRLVDTGDITTFEYIAAGGNQSLSARYTVPTGKTGFLVGWRSSGIVKQIDFRLRSTVDKHDRTLRPGVFSFEDTAVLLDAASGWVPLPWLKIPATGCVKISCLSQAAGGNGGGSYQILLVDN